jgi:hypothetical protein
MGLSRGVELLIDLRRSKQRGRARLAPALALPHHLTILFAHAIAASVSRTMI